MNNKKIEEFLDINLKGEKLDQLMKEMLTEKFDNELKSKYAKTLESEYNITRGDKDNNNVPPKKGRSKALYLILALGLMLIGYFGYKQSAKSTGDNVTQYLASNEMLYQGIMRSDASELSPIKSKAYQAFNTQRFEQFGSLMSTDGNLTLEDKFFAAYAKMRQGAYNEAIKDYEELLIDIQPGEKYHEESSLYRAICLLKTDGKKFESQYNSFDDKSWVKTELDKILN